LLVLIPSVLAVAYLWFVAVDRFQSETRFVLRTHRQSLLAPELPGTLSSGRISRSDDDGYIVEEYLKSRDALQWLQTHADLRAALQLARRDPLWRFPNLTGRADNEALFEHYRRLVGVEYDVTTGVTTLKIQAFSPPDARRFASSLLDAAQTLVNTMNERARRDSISFAEKEAERLRGRLVSAQQALLAFREQEGIIDPKQASFVVVETLSKLMLDVMQINVQISELRQTSPNSPQIATARLRRAALEEQILAERQRLAGDSRSVASRIAEYERLALEQEFVQKALVAAMTAVESARADAAKQQVYLQPVSNPTQPDYPAHPLRLLWSIVVLVSSWMAWRMWVAVSDDALHHIES
jgi:capsular polysaccharide transport system permease protein